jgi:hypothetical protein
MKRAYLRTQRFRKRTKKEDRATEKAEGSEDSG